MLVFLKDSAARDRSDIESILETWRGRVPEGHLMVQRFERIAEEPEALIADIYDYLGVAGGYLPPEDLYKRKVNAYTQDGFSMPDEVRTFIEGACAR